MCPSPQNRGVGGGGNTRLRARGWGLGGVPIPTTGEKASHSAYSVYQLHSAKVQCFEINRGGNLNTKRKCFREHLALCTYLDRKDFIYKHNKTYFADADAIPSKYTFITGYEKQKESSLSAKQHTERPNGISCTFMYNFVHVFPTWFLSPSSAN